MNKLEQRYIVACNALNKCSMIAQLVRVLERAADEEKAQAEQKAIMSVKPEPLYWNGATIEIDGKPSDWTNVQLDLNAIVREVDAEERRRKAIRRFQRTMKRHERRARRMGFDGTAEVLWGIRAGARHHVVNGGWPRLAEDMRGWAAEDRRTSDDGANASTAFIFDRAAEAVARLRTDLEAVK